MTENPFENVEIERFKVNNLEEVSKICHKSIFSKSKILENGKYLVEIVPKDINHIEDPRNVYMEKDVDHSNKELKLDILLEKSNFWHLLEWNRGKKSKDDFTIFIKPNMSATSQKEAKGYTDPILVEHLISEIKKRGYPNIKIVESDTLYLNASKEINVANIAKGLGYKSKVINLSETDLFEIPIKFKKGSFQISKLLVNPDFLINFPKGKNHPEKYLTIGLKNLYGLIPNPDKYRLFHHRKSKMNVSESIVAINNSIPSDFTIVDMIETLDGNNQAVWKRIKTPSDHFFAGLLFAGRDNLVIDKIIEKKMGYKENQSEPLKLMTEFCGYPKKSEFSHLLKNGDISIITNTEGKKWKKVSKGHVFLSSIRDEIISKKISNEFMGKQMRKRFKFTVVDKL